MTLHPLGSKGGAFVSKLGLVFKKHTQTNHSPSDPSNDSSAEASVMA